MSPIHAVVTAVLPRGKQGTKSVFAGIFAGNGNGDMTGTHHHERLSATSAKWDGALIVEDLR
jgi:L-aminopeptidase/D-esterase-like protein